MSSAAADPSRPAGVPERSPVAIRAELPDKLRRQFEAEYRAALQEAQHTYRLDGVDQVVERWWRTVWARDGQPDFRRGMPLLSHVTAVPAARAGYR